MKNIKSIHLNNFPPLNYACNEAINTLCTNLSFSRAGIKRIMITSSQAGEGKSFLAINIMRAMTKLGKRVVLVDCDMRASVLMQKYGAVFEDGAEEIGLAHLLAGMAEEKDVLYSTDIEGAFIVPIGRKVPDALSLLSSPDFGKLIQHLSEVFDYVIVDAPPVGVVIDAAEIARSCDGIVLAVGYNTVRRQELLSVKEQLEQTGCPILGTVLNKVKLNDYVGRKYYYKNYYRNYSKSGYYYMNGAENEKKAGSKTAR